MASMTAAVNWLRAHGPLVEKILTVSATCFAALASWFSYVATDEASAIAGAAYDFTLQTAQETSELQRPVLTVLGGKITPGEVKDNTYTYSPRRNYRIELHVRNSGARDAKPVWLGLATDTFGSAGNAWTKSSIPKDQEVTLFFDLDGDEHALDKLSKVTVAAGFIDLAPKHERVQRGRGQVIEPGPAVFMQTCGEPVVQELTVHPVTTGTGEREIILSLGRSIALPSFREKTLFGVDSVTRNAWEAMSSLNTREIPCKWSY